MKITDDAVEYTRDELIEEIRKIDSSRKAELATLLNLLPEDDPFFQEMMSHAATYD